MGGWLRALPLPLALMGMTAVMMLVPALYAVAWGDHFTARAFFYPAVLTGVLLGFLIIAVQGFRPRSPERSLLRGFVMAYLVLPPLMALPLSQAMPSLGPTAAWFEMVSSFTTTGATLLDPVATPQAVHLWRGLVGWAGGFFVLIAAVGILAPLNLGGFEVYSPGAFGRVKAQPYQAKGARDASLRLLQLVAGLLPVYALLTAVLWLVLLEAGDPGFLALMHAMGTISTSGITPLPLLAMPPSGVTGEMAMALLLLTAISRRFLPMTGTQGHDTPLWRDPEVRLALCIVIAVPLALFVRHWIAAIEGEVRSPPLEILHAVWGATFTTLSFLTTTGFTSAGWEKMGAWSGMDEPGLILMGLAVVGGGVATTAGGVTLLRVHALLTLVRREMNRLAEPSAIAGGGAQARQMRNEGAFMAFVLFMLFTLTVGAVQLSLALIGLPFERALVLTFGAVTTTGPLPEASGLSPGGWHNLSGAAQAILAFAMVLGRLETLAVIALFMPMAWRR